MLKYNSYKQTTLCKDRKFFSFQQFGINRDSQLSTTSSQSDTLSDVFREKTASMVEPSNIPQHDM
jgi:hypothetical protein